METYKISEEKYIMDESLKSAALAVINKYNRSIEKLKKNGQLKDDFPLLSAVFKYPTQKEIPDNIKDKLSNKSVIMKINGIDEIELSNYKVLGSVVAVEGGENYLLNSYTNKDLPEKYRSLQDPCMCEHCNTNRKRNETFILENSETGEFLQVGSTCMDSFIDKTSLKALMNLADMGRSLDNIDPDKIKISRDYTLISKIDVVASMLAWERDRGDVWGVSQKWTERRFEDFFIDYTSNEISVTDEDYELADEMLEFYENLDDSPYRDSVANIKRMLGSEDDFVLYGEALHAAGIVKQYNDLNGGVLAKSHLFKELPFGLEIVYSTGEIKEFNKDEYVYLHRKLYEEFAENNPYTSEANQKLFDILVDPSKMELPYYQFQNNVDQDRVMLKLSMIKGRFAMDRDTPKIKEIADEIVNFEGFKDTLILDRAFGLGNFEKPSKKGVAEIMEWRDQISKKMEEERELEINNNKIKQLNIPDRFDDLQVKLVGMFAQQTAFGQMVVHKFEDSSGNSYVWRTGTGFKNSDEEIMKKVLTIKGASKGISNNVYRNFNDQPREFKFVELTRLKLKEISDDFDNSKPLIEVKVKNKKSQRINS